MAPRKYPTSIRLSPTGADLLKKLSEHLGISQASVIEMALRKLAAKESVR